MRARNSVEQDIHRDVIRNLARQFSPETYDIVDNAREDSPYEVDGVTPDIIAVDPEKRTVRFIIDVATSEEIDERTAQSHWKPLSSDEGVESFFLYVPKAKCREASRIFNDNGIQVTKLIGYSREGTSIKYEDC